MRTALARLRLYWWWVSDSAWRREFTRNRRRIRRFRTAQRLAVNRLLSAFGSKVLAGPFAGMSFSPARRSDAYCAQVLLGTYELEIHDVLEHICRSPYSLAINIGADNGYYVCGLKRRRPDVRIVAFEAALDKHAVIRDLLRENALGNEVAILGLCDSATLQSQLVRADRTLVLCDIDGAEVDVLDPQDATALASADMLIETHDGIRQGTTDLLIGRFSQTHDVQVIAERPRRVTDGPAGVPLTEDQLLAAMDEFRGFQQAWLWLVSKSNNRRTEATGTAA